MIFAYRVHVLYKLLHLIIAYYAATHLCMIRLMYFFARIARRYLTGLFCYMYIAQLI